MMPGIGDRVRILKGEHAGKYGLVESIDESVFSCLHVVGHSRDGAFKAALTPYEVELVSETHTLNDAEIDQIIDGVMGHSGDYVAGVETLAALYRGERDQIKSTNPIDLYPIGEWRRQVANHDTYLGYTAWQAERIEQDR